MPLFSYRARTEQGALVKGELEGESSSDVVRELSALGYIPVQIRRSIAPSPRISFSRKKVRADDLILFTKQFGTIIRTGVPLIRGLQTLRDQAESEEMRRVVNAILKNVQQGNSLGDAMKKHPHVFSPVYYNTVRAGETSGKLEEMLNRLADLLEYERKVKEELKSATRYPILVITVMILAVFILVTFVVPKFMTLYARYNMELPLPTRILMAVSTCFSRYWYVVLIIVAGLIAGLRVLIRTEWGERLWDRVKIEAPIVGKIVFKGILSRMARIFATLSSSGVPILEAMEIVRTTVGNSVVAERIKQIRSQVIEGSGIALPMSRIGGFPPLFVQMVAIGEETGALDDMLLEASRHYEMEIEYHL
ncbi:MAG: hypothetical protein A2Z06_03210, partial [Candidatus Glassbacteria bacterium RBG_16_58_8]